MTTEGTAAAKSDPAAAPGTGTGETKNEPVSGFGRSLTKPEKNSPKNVGFSRQKPTEKTDGKTIFRYSQQWRQNKQTSNTKIKYGTIF